MYFQNNATSVDCFTNALGLISFQLFLNISFEGTRILQTATFYVRPFTLLTIPLLKIRVSPEKTEKKLKRQGTLNTGRVINHERDT